MGAATSVATSLTILQHAIWSAIKHQRPLSDASRIASLQNYMLARAAAHAKSSQVDVQGDFSRRKMSWKRGERCGDMSTCPRVCRHPKQASCNGLWPQVIQAAVLLCGGWYRIGCVALAILEFGYALPNVLPETP